MWSSEQLAQPRLASCGTLSPPLERRRKRGSNVDMSNVPSWEFDFNHPQQRQSMFCKHGPQDVVLTSQENSGSSTNLCLQLLQQDDIPDVFWASELQPVIAKLENPQAQHDASEFMVLLWSLEDGTMILRPSRSLSGCQWKLEMMLVLSSC